MKAVISGSDLQAAIAVVARTAPPLEGAVSLICKANKLYINSVSELSRAEILIPGKVSADNCEFAILLDALRDATKGRDELQMSWDGNILSIKAKGGFNIDLLTVDALARDSLDKAEFTETKISGEQAVWLKNAVNATAIKPTALFANNIIPVTIKLTAKGAFVACYDQEHMAFYNSNEISGDVMLTMPLEKMQTILDVFSSSSFTLRLGSSRVELKNSTTFVAMNLPSLDKGISGEDVITKAREIAKVSGNAVAMEQGAVLQFLENARAVMAKERVEVMCSVESGAVLFNIKTVRGNVKAKVKATAKKTFAFNVDLEFFEELVRKTKGAELNLNVVGKDFCYSTYEQGTILVALNQ